MEYIQALLVSPGQPARPVICGNDPQSVGLLLGCTGAIGRCMYVKEGIAILKCENPFDATFNRVILGSDGLPVDLIYGNFLVTGYKGKDVASLDQAQMRRWALQFKHPHKMTERPDGTKRIDVPFEAIGLSADLFNEMEEEHD